jgi:hypothetical protein
VTTIRRASPERRVLALTQALAEEYAAVPLPDVRRAVREAADLAGWAADGSEETFALIDRLARVELVSLAACAAPAAIPGRSR